MVALASIALVCISGCRKGPEAPDESDSGPAATKTAADYERAAKKDITQENMEAELARLEKEVEADIRTDR
jgi:hypothetical protein